jgi:uncharacterized cupin superfamily protein
VVIAGNSKNGNMVPPPSACPSGAGPIRSQVHSGSKFEESPQGWIPYHLFHGPTSLLTEMEAHVSVLSPGCQPHPPHCHVQEEILIVLRGEAEILIGEGADPARVECLGSGSFVYYPAYQYHTIRNTSSSPVTYLMYKWQAALAEVNYPMQTKIFHANGVPQTSPFQPMSMGVLFEATTAYLDELQAHVTDLQLGAGYPAHIDEHDVAIIVFTGSVETLGQRLGPGGTVFYPAGEPHGMRNVGDEPARYLVFEFHRSKPLMATYAHPVTSVSTEHSKAKARQSITEHAILVFGHTRPQALQFVLEGLRRQDALAATQVWLDGHQEFPELVPFVRACQSLEAAYPEAQWYKYGSRCGFVKLFIDAVLLNCSRYKQLIILQDDCYPAPSAIEALLLSLKEIENNPHIFSVYGHHFGTPDEGTETSAFQCWGWASTSEKLRPIVTELSRLWNMPEPHALAWFNQNVTPAIRTRMDVFSGRSESNLLSGRFCFDAAMSFLIARNGMSNRKTPEHVIYNFGIGERCWHFPALVESYLKPPFNMIKRSDLIERFRLHGLADYEDVPSDGVVEVQEHRHDAEVKRLRIALATSEQDRADRLDVIKHLRARIDLLRAEIEARKHPWRIWASRAAALILVAKSLWSRLLAPVKR